MDLKNRMEKNKNRQYRKNKDHLLIFFLCRKITKINPKVNAFAYFTLIKLMTKKNVYFLVTFLAYFIWIHVAPKLTVFLLVF